MVNSFLQCKKKYVIGKEETQWSEPENSRGESICRHCFTTPYMSDQRSGMLLQMQHNSNTTLLTCFDFYGPK